VPDLSYSSADKSLARPRRKQATFPAFYGTWRFITTSTTVHHLSLPYPNQPIPMPITLFTGTACFLPGRAKDLSAPRYYVLSRNLTEEFDECSWRIAGVQGPGNCKYEVPYTCSAAAFVNIQSGRNFTPAFEEHGWWILLKWWAQRKRLRR